MANLTGINPIGYAQDILVADKSGLIISNVPLNTTDLDQVDFLSVTGLEPAGTTRRFLLEWGGTWYFWDGSAWSAAPTQSPDFNSVISEGNTADTLNALTMANLNTLAGKSINVAIALHAEDPDGAMPTAGFALTGKSSGILTKKTVTSPAIALADEPVEIVDVVLVSTEAAGGSVVVTASADGGAFVAPSSLINEMASTLTFKAVLTAPTVGVSVASLESVTIKYKTGGTDLATGIASIVSKTYDFSQVDGTPLDMGQAHLMVKRMDVPDTKIDAYLSLRTAPSKVDNEILGTGTGEQQTFTLANTNGLAAHTLKVYFGNELQTVSEYAFSAVTGQLTCIAPIDVPIWVSYEYNWQPEVWHKMNRDRAYPDATNQYMINDQFEYVAVEGTDPVGSIASVRVDLIQETGAVVDEVLGNGRGMAFPYRPAHTPKPDTIVIKGNDVVLPKSAWSYDSLTNTLTISAGTDVVLTMTYEWIGQQPQVDSVACVWNLKGV